MHVENQLRFPELLKEFHDSQNMLRVQAERIRSAHLCARIPLFEHYVEGRASWVFDMGTAFKLDEVRKGLVGAPCVASPRFPVLILQVNVADRRVMNDRNQKPMLVSQVDFVHGPDGKIRLSLSFNL